MRQFHGTHRGTLNPVTHWICTVISIHLFIKELHQKRPSSCARKLYKHKSRCVIYPTGPWQIHLFNLARWKKTCTSWRQMIPNPQHIANWVTKFKWNHLRKQGESIRSEQYVKEFGRWRFFEIEGGGPRSQNQFLQSNPIHRSRPCIDIIDPNIHTEVVATEATTLREWTWLLKSSVVDVCLAL